MKRILLITGVTVLSLVMLASCNLLAGKDGKAYIKATFSTAQADGVMYNNFGGFPSSWTLGTEYEISAGDYAVDYVLYWSLWNPSADSYYPGGGHYETSFNGGWIVHGATVSGNLSYYATNKYTSYHKDFSYTITVNKGSFPFKNGADTHFILYMDWNPALTDITSSLTGAKAVIVEDSADRVVKELTEGDTTVRLQINKSAAPAMQDVLAQ
jgi:hypothetical protein